MPHGFSACTSRGDSSIASASWPRATFKRPFKELIMKALILAAGRGTRIRSVHADRPKCLIRFNDSNSTILDNQIESLFAAGVMKIGIVVGYEKDQIIQHVIRK